MLYRAIAAALARRASDVVLTTPEAALTGAALAARVARARGWLRAQSLSGGDRLAVQLPRSLAFLELHLAALAEGIATLPLNPRYTDHEVAWVVADAAPGVVVRPDDLAGLRTTLDAATPVPDPPVDDPDAIGLLCYTSGTTGRPKGAPSAHRNLDATIRALVEAWGMSDADVLLHALPLFHIHGLVVAQHVALRVGAATEWLPRFDADAVLDRAASGDITVFMGVPTFYHRILETGRTDDLSAMRLFTSGSAPLPARNWNGFRDRFGHEILERYGMTEVGIVLSNPLHGTRRPGSVGLPLPGVEVRIVDDADVDVAQGTVGQVLIRGASVFDGYLGRPDATAAALRGGWMHTGDLGLFDEDRYVHLRGRSNDLILRGGFNVYPPEVETVLLDHPGVREAAVVGIPDDDLGERVVAAVVGDDLDAATLRRFAAERLTAYKVPSAIRVLQELPRNAMGKVQKAVLRDDWDIHEPAPFAAEIRELRPRMERAQQAEIDLTQLHTVPGGLRRGEGDSIQQEIAQELLDRWMPDDPDATVLQARAVVAAAAGRAEHLMAAFADLAHKQHDALHDERYRAFNTHVRELMNQQASWRARFDAYDEEATALRGVITACERSKARLPAPDAPAYPRVLEAMTDGIVDLIESTGLEALLPPLGDDRAAWLDALPEAADDAVEAHADAVQQATREVEQLQQRLTHLLG